MKLLTALVLIEALLLIWVFAVEPRLLRVSRYQLEAPDMKGLKMVFASDFHLTPGSKERLRKIVAAINAEKPDIVLLGGDFAKGHLRSVSMPAEEIAVGLAEIKAPAGVFAVLGNHDEWYGKKEMAAALAARGITVLQNDGRQIDYQGISFYLGGVEDVSTGRPGRRPRFVRRCRCCGFAFPLAGRFSRSSRANGADAGRPYPRRAGLCSRFRCADSQFPLRTEISARAKGGKRPPADYLGRARYQYSAGAFLQRAGNCVD